MIVPMKYLNAIAILSLLTVSVPAYAEEAKGTPAPVTQEVKTTKKTVEKTVVKTTPKEEVKKTPTTDVVKTTTETTVEKQDGTTVKKTVETTVEKSAVTAPPKKAEPKKVEAEAPVPKAPTIPKKSYVANEKEKFSPTTNKSGAYGDMRVYVAKYEDTLLDIARRFNLGFVELQAANPSVDPWIPGEGTKIVLPMQHILPDVEHKGIVLSLGDMRLYQFKNGKVVKTYPIGVGREGMHTPAGSTTIVKKAEGPWWYPTPRMRQEDQTLPGVVKQGIKNPLGTHILYLGWPTYGIHGTNEPWGIGRRVSSGCIRMYPEDIPELYETVDLGTKVTVVTQYYKMAQLDDGEFYLEAHPNSAQASAIEYQESKPFDLPNGFIEWLNKKAGDKQDQVNWLRVRQVMLERKGYPIRITNIDDIKAVAAKSNNSGSKIDVKTTPLPYN